MLSTPARALRGIHDKVSPASSFGERSGAVSDGEQMDASTASSVIELLQQGHSAGQYAQTLRDLLRRMSKKNSNLQLKTLEDIIKLGESIVAQDRANQSTSQPAETSTGRYGFGHIRHGSGGGNRAKQGINHSGHSSLETPPANTKYFAETEGTEDYFDSEAKSSLLGEDVPFGRSGKLVSLQ